MLTRLFILAAAIALPTAAAFAQETEFGLTVPVTASVGVMDTHRLQLASPASPQSAIGLRLMLYPTLKLGEHWFGYAAVQVRKMPYFYYDAFFPDRGLDTDIVQAYVGYTVHTTRATLVIKAGQLVSAFGAFPLRYDDLDNPLVDQPLNFIQRLTLPTTQLVCGTQDLLRQHYGFISASCGGIPGRADGITPATLYGMPGIQAEVSLHRFDARVQVTNGSPASLQGWKHYGSYAQWSAGAGVTIRQGFRLGASVFTGPYLDQAVASRLPAGTTLRDFPATGVGIDGQWARGRFSVYGEWQHFRFDQPAFVVPPSITAGYAEVKTTVSPRLYVAGRLGYLKAGGVTDTAGVSSSEFAPLLKSYEAATGVWINRHQLLKVSYSWLQSAGQTGTRNNVYGFELVTHFTPPALPFH